MKRYLLYICAAALLGSCSKSSDGILGEPSQENKVRFAADIPVKEDDWNQATRGAVTNNDNIAHFGVFCFHTGSKLWNEVSTSATPNKMFNVEVSRVGQTAEWTYNPPVEWLGGDGSYFTFFGYSPRAAGLYDPVNNVSGNNIELASTETSPGVPTIGYSTIEDVTQQTDLLLAKPVKDTRPVDKVRMQFAHALAQVRFKAWSAQQGTTPLSIAINGIKYMGTLPTDGSTIAWTADPATADFKLEGNFPVVSTNEQNMTDLSAGDRAFILLPQDLSGNQTATIVIAALVAGTEKTTSYTLKENWETGKSYTYTINMGGNPTEEIIVTGVTITDWMIDGEEDMTTTPPDPAPGDYVKIGTVYWATGNLVATSSTAGSANGCKIGAPTDGGLYFQFGSLIGWKGGAADNGGTGEGAPTYTSGYWGGASSWSWANDAMVWPASMDGNRPGAWQGNTYVGTEADAFKTWYFNFSGTSGGVDYSSGYSNIRDYKHPTLGVFKDGGMARLGVGDPCTYYLGEKWRLPTAEEYKTLCNEKGTTGTGVSWAECNASWTGSGGNFAGTTLFFPASGRRSASSGSFNGVPTYGFVWSSSVSNDASGYGLYFYSSSVYPQNVSTRSYGLPVRCVSDNPM